MTSGMDDANDGSGRQHYVSCAQLKVTGGGGKTPTGIALPGGYDPNSSSFNINIYYPIMTSYTMRKPPVQTPLTHQITRY
jgi:cellulase